MQCGGALKHALECPRSAQSLRAVRLAKYKNLGVEPGPRGQRIRPSHSKSIAEIREQGIIPEFKRWAYGR